MNTILVLGAVIITVGAIKIECNFKMDQLWSQFGYLYTCDVRSITLTDDKSLETMTGMHLSGRSDTDVKLISFGYKYYSCDLTYIPSDLHERFPNLIAIGLYEKCNIQSLIGDELKDYVNLEWFEIYKNPIDKIPGSLFENNPKLKAVYFNENKINNIESNLLTGLDHLTSAEFKENICINKSVYQNRTGVLELIEELSKNCAHPKDPSTTIKVNLDQQKIIEDLKRDNQDLIEKVRDLEQKNKDQDKTIEDLKQFLTMLEAKIVC
jgi:Leucine-rich repeat (LRR) protein